jgi:N-sulfoglucosamine sulfohydrolase
MQSTWRNMTKHLEKLFLPSGRLMILLPLLVLLWSGGAASPAKAQPNILFVIADDWSYGHARIYGDKVVKTPNFDRVAREGALFDYAFCAAPSCSPSRAAILTGQYPHRLEEGANLWGSLPVKFPTYTRILEEQGYFVGLSRKGWGPGNDKAGGYRQNPAGKGYKDFAQFLASNTEGKPFCYWFGTTDPHRPYEPGSGIASGMQPERVQVPAFLPDAPAVRSDILDYYYEIERLALELGEMLRMLEEAGQADNTLIVVTGDNGMPFPRAKANLYDPGVRVPLAIRWKGKIRAGQRIREFVNLTDLAPTFLEAAGQAVPSGMNGKSLLPLLTGKTAEHRSEVYVERERHANVRKGDLGYPCRAVRTGEFLYIRNFFPDRWPAGDPELYHAVGSYGDIDASPSKQYIMDHRAQKAIAPFFVLAFGKRPAEELYDLKLDPGQLNNVAGKPVYKAMLHTLSRKLDVWMQQTGDPRAEAHDDRWDKYPYYGLPEPGAPYKAQQK